jgi:maltose/moltooligosaccharide transporter
MEHSGRARHILAPLFVIQFLSWSGMFCLWIYAVPVITRFVLHAAPDSPAYRQALIVVSACFATYGLLGACLAFALPGIIRRFGHGVVHGVALVIGGAGLAMLGLVDRAGWLLVAFPAIAIGWACMSNIPYALASAAAPEGRGAHFMRMFGFSTVIPQVVVTLGLAVIASSWTEAASEGILIAGGTMMAAGGLIALTLRKRFDVPVEDW